MLYIVSGASRSGKTSVAKALMCEKGIPYFSIDWLMMGFTHGMPELGIHDKLWPHEIAERLWPIVRGMCQNMLWSGIDYVLEGEALMPDMTRALLDAYPQRDIRVCFMGYADMDPNQKLAQIKAHNLGDKDWLTQESDDFIADHINNMIQHSQRVRASCLAHDIRYFDTSPDFSEQTKSVLAYLTQS